MLLSERKHAGFALILGSVAYGFLAALAVVFYLERTVFSDIAFQTFLMLKEGGLQVMVGRYISGVTHFWPWLAVQCGFSLKNILLVFSLAFVLWYFAAFILCLKTFKNWRMALLMLLFSTLMVEGTFYWVTSELPQGAALMFVGFAWLENRGSIKGFRWWDWPLWVFWAVTLVYAHPMLAFPMAFLSLFFAWDGRQKEGFAGLQILTLGLFLTITFVKNKVLPLNWYDAMSMERSAKIWDTFPHWLDVQSNRDFLKWCTGDYLALALCAFFVVLTYFLRREWVKLLLFAFFALVYTLLVNVSFAEGDKQFYLESLYLPLAVFVAVPLVWDVLDFEKKPRLSYLILVCIVGLGLVRIYLGHDNWTQRLGFEKSFLSNTANFTQRKFLLSDKQMDMEIMEMTWGTSYEFLLLSSLVHPDSARLILVDEDPARFDNVKNDKSLFLGEFKNYPLDELPKRYFNPRDTTGYVNYE